MKKILLISAIAVAALVLSSCTGLTGTLGPNGFTGSYTKEFDGGTLTVPIVIQRDK